MSRKLLVAYFLGVALASLPAQQASAWGTGGGIKNPFKQLPNSDLVCDLEDPASTATIVANPCASTSCEDFVFGANDNPFVFQGFMSCREEPIGTGSPGPKGIFELIQLKMAAGLEYTTGSSSEGLVETWTYKVVDESPTDDNEKLLWKLIPIDDDAKSYCPNSADTSNCAVKFGLEEPEDANDYPGGVVFTFQRIGGVPQTLVWNPCHNTSFNKNTPIVCSVEENNETKITRSDGKVEGVVQVRFEFTPVLNLKSKTKSGTINLKICGNDQEGDNQIEFDSSGAPVKTDAPIFINGHEVNFKKFNVNNANSGLCGGNGPDLNLHLHRGAVIEAIKPYCTEPKTPVMISGSLINGGRFASFVDDEDAVIEVRNCPPD